MSKVKEKKVASQTPPRRSTSRRKPINITLFSIVVTALFFVLSVIGALNHESWRDEYQAFLVALHSGSISELMYNMQYEGHPLLWHFLLFVQTRFSDSIFVTKLFHLSVATATVWMICRYLPLNIWQKVALCFSYFLFYEYNLVVRTYAVGVMLLTLAVVIYRLRYIPQLTTEKSFNGFSIIGLSIALFFLTNTSIIGVAMCGCVLALMASDFFVLWRENRLTTKGWLRYGIPAASGLVGAAICLWFIQPEPDNTFPMNYTSGLESEPLKAATSRMFTNLFMLLPNDVQFWNRHVFDDAMLKGLPWAGVLAVAVALLYFLRNNRLLLFFVVAAIAMFGFTYYTQMLQVRYSGHWFVLLALAYAVSLDYKNAKPLFSFSSFGALPQKAFGVMFNAMLGFGLLSGLTAFAKDLTNPFSNLDAAGKYMLQNKLDRLPIVGATDFVISPLTYYTGKPIRLAESKRTGYFIRWNKDRTVEKLDFLAVIGEIKTVMAEGNDSVLVILDTPVRIVVNGQPVEFSEDNLPGTDIHLRMFHRIEAPSIVPDEKYYFYLATRVVK